MKRYMLIKKAYNDSRTVVSVWNSEPECKSLLDRVLMVTRQSSHSVRSGQRMEWSGRAVIIVKQRNEVTAR